MSLENKLFKSQGWKLNLFLWQSQWSIIVWLPLIKLDRYQYLVWPVERREGWGLTGCELEDKVGSDLLFVFSEPTQSEHPGREGFPSQLQLPCAPVNFTKNATSTPHLSSPSRVQKNNTNGVSGRDWIYLFRETASRQLKHSVHCLDFVGFSWWCCWWW